jgi:hypothetical protein
MSRDVSKAWEFRCPLGIRPFESARSPQRYLEDLRFAGCTAMSNANPRRCRTTKLLRCMPIMRLGMLGGASAYGVFEESSNCSFTSVGFPSFSLIASGLNGVLPNCPDGDPEAGP